MTERLKTTAGGGIPKWVPSYAVRYLEHTQKGVSIRELARHSNCHASTIMRQIRRVEARREDPLIDAALETLGSEVYRAFDRNTQTTATTDDRPVDVNFPTDQALEASIVEILSKMSETGAVLAIAPGLEKGVILSDPSFGAEQTNLSVDRKLAEAMALNDWITCQKPGKISRYVITPEGRSALQASFAKQENKARIKKEDQADLKPEPALPSPSGAQVRFHRHENPLTVLARRSDKDGKPFLTRELVRAGERLREDFELAHFSPEISMERKEWSEATGITQSPELKKEGVNAARQRLDDALSSLGEGLADVALRCCCHLEGMEATEKRMGWPARSGKVVLRIALTHLAQHYRSAPNESTHLIW